MMELIFRLSNKKDWDRRVFDNEISEKWRKKVLATPNVDISAKMVEWVGPCYLSWIPSPDHNPSTLRTFCSLG